MARLSRRTAVLGAFLSTIASSVSGQVVGSCDSSVAESTLDIANVRSHVYANGSMFWRAGRPAEDRGYEVPKGSGISAVLASGFWIGGRVRDELRVAASRYGPYSFWTGPLDQEGSPVADCSNFDRIWKVSRSDVEEFDAGGQPSIDLVDWPTGLGAPTLSPFNDDGTRTDSDQVDNNADGAIDEPGEMRSITDEILDLPLAERMGRKIDLEIGERPAMLGDQMLWWILNDVGNQKVFGYEADGVTPANVSPPIGLEVHASAFAYSIPGDIKNVTFYRLRIFNKGESELTEAFLGMFADVDLGNAFDDYVGSDSTLGLGLVYNADNDDDGPDGYGPAPPALAYDILQGPLVESELDTAFVHAGMRLGFRELQMTSFVSYKNGRGPYEDPSAPEDYYNYLQAFWKDGSPLTYGDEGYTIGNPPTKFMYPTDPTTGHYWSELSVRCDPAACAPSDRRFVLGSGPFVIDIGEGQDVFYAIIWARGEDNLDSYTQTVRAARVTQSFFDAGLGGPSQSERPTITQTELRWSTVYPTPGRGQTTLEYSLPSDVSVTVDVFDTLGRRTISIERGVEEAGSHALPFDTSHWPSGVYFVRMSLNGRRVAFQQFVVL